MSQANDAGRTSTRGSASLEQLRGELTAEGWTLQDVDDALAVTCPAAFRGTTAALTVADAQLVRVWLCAYATNALHVEAWRLGALGCPPPSIARRTGLSLRWVQALLATPYL